MRGHTDNTAAGLVIGNIRGKGSNAAVSAYRRIVAVH